MASKSNNNDGGAGWIGLLIILGIVFVMVGIALTVIGMIAGLVIVIFLSIFCAVFDWRDKKGFIYFCLFVVGVCLYGLAFLVANSNDINLWDYYWATFGLMYNVSYEYGIKHIQDLPESVKLIVVFAGSCISACILRVIAICFAGNQDLQDVKDGKAKEKYTKKVKQKDFDRLDITTGAIGISYTNKRPVYITDKMINEMLLALGTTGAGKTVLMRNFYARNILLNNSCIVVDGKPDSRNIEFLRDLADKNNVPFYGFNCENNLGYDFLNNGTATEIKDKLIGLKNEQDWDSDYYKTQAETYLQTAIEVIKNVKGKITLEDVIDCMDFEMLESLLGDIDERLQKRVLRIKNTELKDLKGIQNQLTLLANSDMGDWLSSGASNEFTLLETIERGGFVYFALPSLKYPSFSKVMGKLVVNDIKTALYDKDIETPVFCFFDEFEVFAGEQVINLVNQGRGLGLNCGFGTQSLAGLSKQGGNDFMETFMGNINTVTIMRVNDNKTTKYLTEWVGKTKEQEYSATVGDIDINVGNVKMVDKFLIEAQEMQQLGKGEAYLISKVHGFGFDKIKVNYYQGE